MSEKINIQKNDLQLPITSRILAFEQAVLELGDTHPLVFQYREIRVNCLDARDKCNFDLLAYLKLRIVCEALNEGWEPQFTEGEVRYYPWHCLYTQIELDEMDNDKKTKCAIISTNDYKTDYYGFGCNGLYYSSSFSFAHICSRLCFKSRELALYAGRQFIDLYADFYLIRKVNHIINRTMETKELSIDSYEQAPVVTSQDEGIYIIYTDGHSEPYTGTNAKKGVAYIGVVFQGHRFAVSLTEIKAMRLKDDTDVTTCIYYKKRECDALFDFDSFINTAKLVADNDALADHLKKGEAIPALGVLEIICHLKLQINEALAYVGGESLTNNSYWSSTERSETHVWNVHFGNDGTTWSDYKYFCYAVRAVAAF